MEKGERKGPEWKRPTSHPLHNCRHRALSSNSTPGTLPNALDEVSLQLSLHPTRKTGTVTIPNSCLPALPLGLSGSLGLCLPDSDTHFPRLHSSRGQISSGSPHSGPQRLQLERNVFLPHHLRLPEAPATTCATTDGLGRRTCEKGGKDENKDLPVPPSWSF